MDHMVRLPLTLSSMRPGKHKETQVLVLFAIPPDTILPAVPGKKMASPVKPAMVLFLKITPPIQHQSIVPPYFAETATAMLVSVGKIGKAALIINAI